ncbi:MAG: winged helix-turn-helix transcriptional regulator [Treponema sp.]|nr:winged helix-turn-helix transcriptional regulator [Treponema sp.]
MIDKATLEKTKSLFDKCSPLFLALGDSQRQKILMDIAEAGEINVSDLASMSSLSRPAVSHHLKLLKDYGVVAAIKKGTQVFYRLHILPSLEVLTNLIKEINTIARHYTFGAV